MTWKQEPYKSAKRITGNKAAALVLINLIGQVKAMGLTVYPDNEFIHEGIENE